MAVHVAQVHEDAAVEADAPDITIVLPTFNEAANVEPMVDRLDRALRDVRWEVIFVDDNSPDGTADRARDVGRRDTRVRCIRRVGRRGRASACLEGMMAAQAPVVAVMDADQQHDEAVLPEMLGPLLEDEADLVVGTRYIEGGSAPGLRGIRQTISTWAGRVARIALPLPLSDPTSGFFATRRDVADRFVSTSVADGFNTMLDVATSRRLDLRIKEVPYSFRSREHGRSKLGMREGIEFIALLGSRLTGSLIPPRFILFCAVGGTGVVVHLVALALMLGAGASFAIGQATATLVAVANNFALNNLMTFRDRKLHGRAQLRGLVEYGVICSFGAISNVSIAAWLFANDNVWWVAGLAGAVVSAVWNYTASSTLIWRR